MGKKVKAMAHFVDHLDSFVVHFFSRKWAIENSKNAIKLKNIVLMTLKYFSGPLGPLYGTIYSLYTHSTTIYTISLLCDRKVDRVDHWGLNSSVCQKNEANAFVVVTNVGHKTDHFLKKWTIFC